MDGFINLLKPPGMTSHDAVGYVRRQLGEKKLDMQVLLILVRQEYCPLP